MSRAIRVGILVVGGVILFCVGLFLIGTRAQLFAHRFDVYAQFNDVETLQPGPRCAWAGWMRVRSLPSIFRTNRHPPSG